MDRLPKDCIACGRCMDVCPLFTSTGHEELSPKATHQLVMQLRAGSTAVQPRKAEQLAAMCLGCGRCAATCPQGLDTAATVAALRAGHPDWRSWLWKQWITRAGVLWPLMAQAFEHVPAAFPEAMAGARGLALPEVTPWLQVVQWDVWGGGREVAIFPGCTATHLRPQWVARARRILEHCGFRVLEVKGFGCCGATLGHAGLPEARREMQRRNIKAWRKAGRPLLVSFCASCRAGLTDYGDGSEALVKGWDAVEAARFRDAVQPLSPFFRQTRLEVDQARRPQYVVWHQPCHAREGNPDGPFLQRVLGAALDHAVTDRCCGLGGVMQLGGTGLPARVAAACWKALLPMGAAGGEGTTRPAQVLTGCSGCTVQLGATAPGGVTVSHWLDILES
ncbi:(Fe-S)-binding protein [Megalodesulfovibrio paquesii]